LCLFRVNCQFFSQKNFAKEKFWSHNKENLSASYLAKATHSVKIGAEVKKKKKTIRPPPSVFIFFAKKHAKSKYYSRISPRASPTQNKNFRAPKLLWGMQLKYLTVSIYLTVL
jgi:hypothetical protein